MQIIGGLYTRTNSLHFESHFLGRSGLDGTRMSSTNHYCLMQSAPDALASLVISAELTPVRIILGHCTPVLLVCPSTGGEDPAGRDRPGYKLSRVIYGHSIWSGDSSTACTDRTAWQTLVETATSLTSSG